MLSFHFSVSSGRQNVSDPSAYQGDELHVTLYCVRARGTQLCCRSACCTLLVSVAIVSAWVAPAPWEYSLSP